MTAPAFLFPIASTRPAHAKRSGRTEGFSLFHVLYAIFGEPLPPWKSNPYGDDQNAWTNALEFAIAKTGAKGKATEIDAISRIAHYLNRNHGLEYDVMFPNPSFLDGPDNSCFNLTAFMGKTEAVKPGVIPTSKLVNCDDMATGVTVFGNLLGVGTKRLHMNRFGYINTLWLVGIGECNNPFYVKTTSGFPITDSDAVYPEREFFHNHSFAGFDGIIFDACAESEQGLTVEAYFNATIDESTPAEQTVSGRNEPITENLCLEVF